MKCGGSFDRPGIEESISVLQKKSIDPNFWDDNKSAQKILKKISFYKNELKMWSDLDSHFYEVQSYLELLDEGEDVESDAMASFKAFKLICQLVYAAVGFLKLGFNSLFNSLLFIWKFVN